MGKKNKNKGQKNSAPIQVKAQPKPFTEDNLIEAQLIDESAKEVIDPETELSALSGRDLEESEKAEKKSDLLQYLQYLKEVNQRLAKQREMQDAIEAKANERQAEAQQQINEYKQKNEKLVAKEKELTQKAFELDNGEYSTVIRTLIDSLKASEEKVFASTNDIIDQLTSSLIKYQEEAKDVTLQREQLLRDQAELEKKEKILKRKLQNQQEDSEALRLNIQEELEEKYGAQLSSLKSVKERLERENNRLKETESALNQQLAQIMSTFDTTDTNEMLAAYRAIQKRVKELKLELQSRPYQEELASEQEKNAYLEQELTKARNEINDERLSELKSRLYEKDKLELIITNLKEQLSSKNIQIDTLEHTIDEQKSTIELLNGEKKKVEDAFETARLYDADIDLQTPIRAVQSYPKDLNDLVIYLQSKMASTGKPFYYDLDTIRVFIAGLHMTPITILQGISGTGKTSLPRELAKAMVAASEQLVGIDNYSMPNAPYRICAIQSGWRDNMDIMGYYNSFDNSYKETDFFKALYLASLPKYEHTLFFIILDEMNLSRPEHYFADFLSLLEQSEEERYIGLNAPKNALPNSAKSGKLKIPKNVRFIGTANHDETTLEFAPKTYDRSNVLEMPRNASHDIQPTDKNYCVPYEWLAREFRKSEKEYNKYYTRFYEFISNDLTKSCFADVNIGIGNRFEDQARRFICAFLASGDDLERDIAYAADHLITSRLFRSLRNNFQIDVAKMKMFREDYVELFKTTFKREPIKAKKLLDEEIAKK